MSRRSWPMSAVLIGLLAAAAAGSLRAGEKRPPRKPKPPKPEVAVAEPGPTTTPSGTPTPVETGPSLTTSVTPLPPEPPLDVPGAAMAGGAEGVAPKPGLEDVRLEAVNQTAPWGEAAEFRLSGPAEFLDTAVGRYVLRDELGRELSRGTLKPGELKPGEDGARRFSVPTGLAVVREHALELALVGADDRRVERRAAVRLSRAPAWDGWRTLLHAPYPDGHWAALAAMGVHGGLAYRLNAERRKTLRAAGAPFYVENVARQFLSRHHAERGLWEQLVQRAAADPRNRAACVREPSLCSRECAEGYVRELERHAAEYRSDAPLFYSLASEPSVTRLAAAFDFDFHTEALAEFGRWLERDVYGTLSALNASWGTEHKDWGEVQPWTTAEALARLKEGAASFAPWVDFRVFQDHSFAKFLCEGGRILRLSDPQARVGITGALGPFAFGGWDWVRLGQALDVVEAYDIGCARELWRDLAPGKPALAMAALQAQPEALNDLRRSLWRLALEGSLRGTLLWDEAPAEGGAAARVLLTPEGKPTPAADALAPTLRELGGHLGRLLRQAQPERATVGLLYSPAGVRLHWLLEAGRLHPDNWLETWGADTAAERCESAQLRLRLSWAKLLSDLGLPWRFVSSAEIEAGVLAARDSGLRALVLPRCVALSNVEIEALKSFTGAGGLLVADACCGRFDEHGRRRQGPPLDELFGLDTSREPAAAEPPHALDSVRDASEKGQPPLLPPGECSALPPAFSDKLAWLKPPAQRLEYRRSPVLTRRALGEGAAVYLNLDLERYLSWRLHPEAPRAAALRAALAKLVFARELAALHEDLQASSLPPCTELIRLRLGAGAAAPYLLALRRNFQERLHEVGLEGDASRDLEAPAQFRLVLRQAAFALDLRKGGAANQTGRIEGTLDPAAPTLLILRPKLPPAPVIQAPDTAAAGREMAVRIQPGAGAQGAPTQYLLQVKGPDGEERPWYGGAYWSPDGVLELRVPLALSDPPGKWTLGLRDVTSGQATSRVVKVAPGG